jgi:formate hydrogenlyase subunit 6/NADH:ubiquinone oxidoreductase subunit I
MLGSLAAAIERFPPPDFSDHQLPATTTPAPSAWSWQVIDIAVLVIALGLGSWLAVGRRSRRGILVLSILALVYFGFFRAGCICAIGSIQNVALGLFDSSYIVPLAAIGFFLAPVIFTLLFGRTFCAAVCPHGALQDLVLLRSVNVPRPLDSALSLFAHVYLALAVLVAVTGAGFLICRYDPFVGIFRLAGNFDLLLLGGLFVGVSLFIARPYCRWVCPLGAIFRVISPISRWHVNIYPDRCINCHLCAEACPVNAIDASAGDDPAGGAAAPRRRAMIGTLAAVPLVIIGLGWAVSLASDGLAELHPTIQLANRIAAEQTGQVEGRTDASEAFHQAGRDPQALYQQARAVRGSFAVGTWFVGGWIGLILAGRMIRGVFGRQSHDSYRIDASSCVVCGRCFEYCPRDPSCQHQVTGLIAEQRQAPGRSALAQLTDHGQPASADQSDEPEKAGAGA